MGAEIGMSQQRRTDGVRSEVVTAVKMSTIVLCRHAVRYFPADGGSMFHRTVDIHLQVDTTSQHKYRETGGV